MTDLDGAGREFAELAANLRLVGEEELHRELYKAIDTAARPLARKIRSVEHLDPYLPNRYAEVLASDLAVTTSKRTVGDAVGVSLVAKGRRRNRHVKRIEQGILRHPVFGTEAQLAAELVRTGRLIHGRGWTWVSQQVQPGFFTDPTEAAGPEVRRQILQAMHRIAERAVGR